jgi:7-carboxy-7-deazaguanine synthase
MSYAVKEIFYTLQGEGANTGRPAVFCRFAGCNLWSGHEPDRATAACRFCDTDFVGVDGPGGGRFGASSEAASRFVVCTGGEPLLQLDAPLIESLHAEGFTIAIETNGTQPGLDGIDWVCVSPKAGAGLVLRQGNELKLIYPQAGIDPESLQGLPFTHFFLQPMDGPDRLRNTQLAVQYCLEHPRWRLSLQTHKLLGIP